MDVLEWLVEVCAPCTGNPPVSGTGAGGAAGPFGSAGSSSGGGGPPPDKKPGPCDQLGSGGSGTPGPGDIAADVGTGLATDAALDVAGEIAVKSGGTGGGAGVLGVLGTLISGSETGARGYINIKCSKGRGFGGGSKAAEDAFDQIARDKANNEELARQMRGGR